MQLHRPYAVELHRPYALERTIVRAHPSVRGRTCAVSLEASGLVVTAELSPAEADPAGVEQAIRLALALDHGIDLHAFIPRERPTPVSAAGVGEAR